MSNTILIQVQSYLAKVASGGKDIKLPPELLEEYAEACKRSLKRQLEEHRDNFRLRMSNVGKPFCMLWNEKNKTKGLNPPYTMPLIGMFGDVIEALLIAIMKQAGVNIISEFEHVTLKIAGIDLQGTLDVVIDDGSGPGVYDIKSASSFSFSKKFSSVDNLAKNDAFGYLPQGFLYGKAKGLPFKGYILINKDTAEINVLEVDQKYAEEALRYAEENIKALLENAEFRKCFSPVAETYRRKPTGNEHLGIECSYCNFKLSCFPTAIYKASPVSDAENKPWKWYTSVAPRE